MAAKKTDTTALFDYLLHWLLGLVLVGLFGWMFWQALRRFLNALDEPDPARAGFWIESHWGGLGGGLGGWRVSNAIVYLILLSILGGLVLATATYVVPSLSKDTAGGAKKTGKLGEGGQKPGVAHEEKETTEPPAVEETSPEPGKPQSQEKDGGGTENPKARKEDGKSTKDGTGNVPVKKPGGGKE